MLKGTFHHRWRGLSWIGFKKAASSEALQPPSPLRSEHILFYEGEIRDGNGETAGKRLFALYARDDDMKEVPPSLLWDLAEGTAADRNETLDREGLKSRASEAVIASLEKYRTEISNERTRQAAIKKKYGVKSLETLPTSPRPDGKLLSTRSSIRALS
jgi:hypothetical protein